MNNIAPLVLLAVVLVGCSPASNTAGSPTGGPTLEEIATWLKIEYYPKTPKSPAYVSGQPSIVPIVQLASIFSAIRADVDVTKATFDYCNLSPPQWAGLRAQTQTVYLVAWSSNPDAHSDREVATVDLRTHVFKIRTCSAQDFTNRLAQMESVIRKATGQEDFSLRTLRHHKCAG